MNTYAIWLAALLRSLPPHPDTHALADAMRLALARAQELGILIK